MKNSARSHRFGHPGRVVRCFGSACLIRDNSGNHELVGGGNEEFTAAKEWVSLFAHTVVFSRAAKTSIK
jgi:hypothetical protein